MTRQTAAAHEKADHFGGSGAPGELLAKRGEADSAPHNVKAPASLQG